MLTPKKTSVTETILIVGPYRIPVPKERFQQWEKDLMRQAGFTDKAIKAEIRRRLGI